MSLDFILHSTTNLHSCSIKTLVDVLAQILNSFQSSRDLNIDMTIKKKKKLRTVRDHILIGEFGPIVRRRPLLQTPLLMSSCQSCAYKDHNRPLSTRFIIEKFTGILLQHCLRKQSFWERRPELSHILQVLHHSCRVLSFLHLGPSFQSITKGYLLFVIGVEIASKDAYK